MKQQFQELKSSSLTEFKSSTGKKLNGTNKNLDNIDKNVCQ